MLEILKDYLGKNIQVYNNFLLWNNVMGDHRGENKRKRVGLFLQPEIQ